jgi:hypothetical protein
MILQMFFLGGSKCRGISDVMLVIVDEYGVHVRLETMGRISTLVPC